jgi:restriction endonuclease S subunit
MTFFVDKKTWTRVLFDDVVINVNETTNDPVSNGIDYFVGLDHLQSGDLKVKRFGNTADGVTFTKIVSPGQTLFGKRRAYQRKVAFADFKAVCSGDILTFAPKGKTLLGDYLPFLVMSEGFFKKALSTSAGSLSPRTRWSDLAKFEFLLPPIDQQAEIAKLFWSLEKSIESKNNLAAKLAITLDRSIKTEIEKCISFKPLSLVADVLDSQRIPVNSAERNLRAGAVPYYGAGGQVGWIDEAIFDEDLVLVGEDATLDVYRISGPSWVNNHAHVLRGKTISNNWLFYVLSRMDLKSKATNGTRLKLTQAALNGIEIPIPAEEEVVVARMREIEQSINLNMTEIEEEKKLRLALNAEFFGEI